MLNPKRAPVMVEAIMPDKNISRLQSSPRFALLLLTLSYAACHLDRNIVTILLVPIKAEFGVSDTALGLLTGLTFALFYGVLGIPLGYVADRANRRHLLGFSLTLFSALTLLSGYVTSFAQLVGARIGVGVGEGGAVPTAQSILADIFPPHRRVYALGIYSTGLSIGALAGLAIGGFVSAAYGWRVAFIAVGIVSLIISLLNWVFIAEPARTSEPGEGSEAASAPAPSMISAARHLWKDQPAYRHLVMAVSIAAIPGFSLLVWAPTLFSRHFDMSQSEIGLWLGLLFGVGGGIGILTSSFLAGRLSQRAIGLALLPPIAGCCLVGIFGMLFAFAPSASLAILLLVVPAAGYCCYTGPVYGVIHAIAESRVRARAIAVLLLASNIAGFGLGPALTGVLSDYLAATMGSASINFALMVMNIGWFWAAVHFWIAMRKLSGSSITAAMAVQLQGGS